MIQIYTGNGKGKTTAAIGLAFRALGHGKRVLMIQFMKKGSDTGEVKAARRFARFEIVQAGRKGRVGRDTVSSKDRQLAEKGLALARKALKSNKYDLIILDELNVAVEFGLLQYQQVEETLKDRTREQEIIITGRYASAEILKIADLASEVRELKHYYKNGIAARAGIEY